MEQKEKKRLEGKKKAVGTVSTRGRTFQGKVTKRFEKRVVIDFERTLRVPKYERFMKRNTKLHARIPEGMEVSVGDVVKVKECRPLSKIIHFQIIEVVKPKIKESKK